MRFLLNLTINLVGHLAGVLIASQFALQFAHAEVGVSETEIRIGSTCDMSGGIAKIGQSFTDGARVYYDLANSAGGVAGRKINFLPKDDGYQPARAVDNVKHLIENDKVFALVSSIGTPVLQAIMPQIESSGLLLLFSGSGGTIAYPDPPKKNIFQVGLSYSGEATNLIRFAVDRLKLKSIGVFYQDDAFGIAGRSGVEKTLAEHQLKIEGLGTYQRNSSEVDAAVEAMKAANPKAVYLQAVGKPAIEFIKKCLAKNFKPVFLGSSALGGIGVKEELAGQPVEIYISDVVPPVDRKIPLMQRFNKDMASAGKSSNAFSLHGYLGALLFVAAAKRVGKNLTRGSLVDALEKMHDFDLGGVKVDFSPNKHVGLNSSFIFHLVNGELTPVD